MDTLRADYVNSWLSRQVPSDVDVPEVVPSRGSALALFLEAGGAGARCASALGAIPHVCSEVLCDGEVQGVPTK